MVHTRTHTSVGRGVTPYKNITALNTLSIVCRLFVKLYGNSYDMAQTATIDVTRSQKVLSSSCINLSSSVTDFSTRFLFDFSIRVTCSTIVHLLLLIVFLFLPLRFLTQVFHAALYMLLFALRLLCAPVVMGRRLLGFALAYPLLFHIFFLNYHLF